MRDLTWGSSNVLGVKEALLSVLAGDVFGNTPIRRSLLIQGNLLRRFWLT
jgi:hypothetical protein